MQRPPRPRRAPEAEPLKLRTLATAALLGLAALTAGACGGGDPAATIKLDGSPRVPDDEGVVTSVDVEGRRLILDGERDYEVSEQLKSFSALDLSTQPLADTEGAYVQVGLSDDIVVWIGRIAQLVPTEPPAAFYVGRFESIREIEGIRRAVFGEGTVLQLDEGVEPPEGAEGQVLQAQIDPKSHSVTSLGSG